MTEQNICPYCDKEIDSEAIFRMVACNEHMDNFILDMRQKKKPINFQKAYYRQRRRVAKSKGMETSGKHNCKYCNEEFDRKGSEMFCPSSNCYDLFMADNYSSSDYSVLKKDELEKLYYDDNLSFKGIAEWYQANKKIKISFDTVRSIMLGYGISWEEKRKRAKGAVK